MSLFLVRATPNRHEQKNSSQVNAYIVDAADEAAARAAALAASPTAECRPKASWQALPLAGITTPIVVQGTAFIPANSEFLRGH